MTLEKKVFTHFFCEPSFPICIKTKKKKDSAVHLGSLISFLQQVNTH